MDLQHRRMNGISLEDSSGATVRGNLIADSRGAGIDTLSSTGAHTIENNTITTNGTGTGRDPRYPDLWHRNDGRLAT